MHYSAWYEWLVTAARPMQHPWHLCRQWVQRIGKWISGPFLMGLDTNYALYPPLIGPCLWLSARNPLHDPPLSGYQILCITKQEACRTPQLLTSSDTFWLLLKGTSGLCWRSENAFHTHLGWFLRRKEAVHGFTTPQNTSGCDPKSLAPNGRAFPFNRQGALRAFSCRPGIHGYSNLWIPSCR